MTYSYARPTTPEDVSRDVDALVQRAFPSAAPPSRRWGSLHEMNRFMDSRKARFAALPTQPYLAVRGTLTDTGVRDGGLAYGALGDDIFVILPAEADLEDEQTYIGRLEIVGRPDYYAINLDTTASRFTGASIAGLVVGAMGCFIFGLYMRTWLGERKALARQPEQDMIA